jgi:hypothetical protein
VAVTDDVLQDLHPVVKALPQPPNTRISAPDADDCGRHRFRDVLHEDITSSAPTCQECANRAGYRHRRVCFHLDPRPARADADPPATRCLYANSITRG